MHDCVEENGQFASFSFPGARDEERRTIRIGKAEVNNDIMECLDLLNPVSV